MTFLQLTYADYVKPVPVANFKAAWDELDPESEVAGDYGLGVVSGGVKGTVEAMIAHMGMFVADGTDLVTETARSHMILLSGELCRGHRALLRISFGLGQSGEMAMKVVSRADDRDVSELLHAIVQDA
jgi:hypothetical protein